MKYIISSLLIVFLTLSAFSFGFMNHEGGHLVGNCIASTIDKSLCPQSGLITALHHISAYQTFSQALTPFSLTVSLLLILGLFVLRFILGFIFSKNHFLENNFALFSPESQYKRNKPELYLNRPREITAWLSLFENSPSFS